MIGPILGGRPRRLRISSRLNLVCDGNSLTAGYHAYPWPRGLPSRAGFNVISINGVVNPTVGTYKGIAVTGQTTRQMNGLDGGLTDDVDGCWRDGMDNRLVEWEGTNSMFDGNRTAAQAIQDLTDYNTARQAYVAANRPGQRWFIIAMTVLPRGAGSDSANATMNGIIDQYNAYLLANYKAMGADAVIDIRQAGSPFNLPDYTVASFENARATTGLWIDTGIDAYGRLTHLSSAGYDVLIDQFIVPGLKSLPAR